MKKYTGEEKKMNRKTIFCNDEVKQWLEDYSRQTGLSMSAIVNMAINEYRMHQNVMKLGVQLPDLFKQFQAIQAMQEGLNRDNKK